MESCTCGHSLEAHGASEHTAPCFTNNCECRNFQTSAERAAELNETFRQAARDGTLYE